jgi:[ribosomal protein S18]-alanine N-acetyltransferase
VSALPSSGLYLRAMAYGDLDRVLEVERVAYGFPWTRGNFVDSLAAGYLAEMLLDERGALVGYYLALQGVDEMHLLNLTVAPVHQRRGHARMLLDALEQRCHERQVPRLWLEVRASNARARQLYAARGFAEVGLRRGYYPAGKGLREDAIVMGLLLQEA